MFSDEYLKGFRSAVSAYAMNTPRGAYDAKPTRFTPRRPASDQTAIKPERTSKPDNEQPLSDELMALLHAQLDPDTFQMLKDALNGTADDQDPDEEEDQPASLSPSLIDKICELVGPHLSDGNFEQFKQLLDGVSSKLAEDLPPPFSGRPTPGGGQDPSTAASRARPSYSFAEDAKRIKSLTPGQLAYDMGSPFTGERGGIRYYQGVRLKGPRRKVDASSLQSYAKRFPGTARIKVL
jgi:hypothetical protein